jgi:hypothetical protein
MTHLIDVDKFEYFRSEGIFLETSFLDDIDSVRIWFCPNDKVQTVDQLIERVIVNPMYVDVISVMAGVEPDLVPTLCLALMIMSMQTRHGFFPVQMVVNEIAIRISAMNPEKLNFAMEACDNIVNSPNIGYLEPGYDFESEVTMEEDFNTFVDNLVCEIKCPVINTEVRTSHDTVLEISSVSIPMLRRYKDLSEDTIFRNGQLKLFNSLSDFITEFAPSALNVVYLAASPGINIASVAIANQHRTFYLTDICEVYYEPLMEMPNVIFFTEIEEVLHLPPDVTCIYSDIFSGIMGSSSLHFQLSYINRIPGEFVCVKQNILWGSHDNVTHLHSRLRIQQHVGRSGELREWYRKSETQHDFKQINMINLEGRYAYYEQEVRASLVNFNSVITGCNHYDCCKTSLTYSCNLRRTPPHLRPQFKQHFLACFNSKIKSDCTARRNEAPLMSDILGIPPMITTRNNSQAYPTSSILVTQDDLTKRMFVPNYIHYPDTNSITSRVNGTRFRHNLQDSQLPCMRHRLPHSFPLLSFVQHELLQGRNVVHSCGCEVLYQLTESAKLQSHILDEDGESMARRIEFGDDVCSYYDSASSVSFSIDSEDDLDWGYY